MKKDYPAVLDEFATSPASSLVLLHMIGRAPSKPLSKKKGVTVGDVLKWIGKYWTPVDLERALGSHPFFEGWEAAVAKGQNWTDLVSNWFGSSCLSVRPFETLPNDRAISQFVPSLA